MVAGMPVAKRFSVRFYIMKHFDEEKKIIMQCIHSNLTHAQGLVQIQGCSHYRLTRIQRKALHMYGYHNVIPIR